MVLYTLFCLKCFKWLYFGVILDYLVRDIHVYKFFVGFCDFLKLSVNILLIVCIVCIFVVYLYVEFLHSDNLKFFYYALKLEW